MRIYLLFENEELFAGSVIDVESETETHYTGIHSSAMGSYTVTVEKHFCAVVPENMDYMERLKWADDVLKQRERELILKGILDED